MKASSNCDSPLRFGQFEADLSEEKLFKRGLLVRLENQPYQILAALLEHPGEIVSREQLRTRLWPNGTYVDFDESLNTAVRKLRYALNDSAENPSFIETVPRKGYRFIAPVVACASENAATMPQAVSPETVRGAWKFLFSLRTMVVVGIAFACLAGVALLLARSRSQRPVEPEFSKLSFGRGAVTSARFAPDGQTVFYAAAWDGKPLQLFSTAISGLGARAREIPGDILSISRNGQMAVLVDMNNQYPMRQGTLAIVPPGAGSLHKVLENVQDADWSLDGSKLLAAHWIGTQCRLEFPIGKVLYEENGVWISTPRMSPDGTKIAFLRHPRWSDDAGFVSVIDLASHKTDLSPMFPSVGGLAWDPSGKTVWFTAIELDNHGGHAIFQVSMRGKLRLIRRESSDITLHDIATDGRVLMVRESVKAEVIGRIYPEQKERDFGWLDNGLPTGLTSDGSKVLLSVQGEAAGQHYLTYLQNTTAGSPTLLGEGMGTAISPDGKKVVAIYPWVPQSSSMSQLILLPTGTGQPEQMTHDSINHHWAAWFPDGQRLLFMGNEQGRPWRTWMQNLDGGPPTPVTPEGTAGRWISKEGNLLAAPDADQTIWLYPLDGGQPRIVSKLAPGEEIICWTADSRALLVFKYAVPSEVHRIEIATGRRRMLVQLAPSDTAGVTVVGPVLMTPDARSYVYNYSRVLSDLYVAAGLR
ncbi:MAG: winged helix-turn-helix domain-containing protein [Candidatus Sulfotelmatobacter sp.]